MTKASTKKTTPKDPKEKKPEQILVKGKNGSKAKKEINSKEINSKDDKKSKKLKKYQEKN